MTLYDFRTVVELCHSVCSADFAKMNQRSGDGDADQGQRDVGYGMQGYKTESKIRDEGCGTGGDSTKSKLGCNGLPTQTGGNDPEQPVLKLRLKGKDVDGWLDTSDPKFTHSKQSHTESEPVRDKQEEENNHAESDEEFFEASSDPNDEGSYENETSLSKGDDEESYETDTSQSNNDENPI